MKKLQSNSYQCRVRRVWSKKSKPIPTLPRGAGLNLTPSPLHYLCNAGKIRVGRNGVGQVKRSRTKLPSLCHTIK